MKKMTFKRGVHPPDTKGVTDDLKIEVILPLEGSELVYPMIQHIGAPCTPCVTIGQKLLVGEKIGEANGAMSCPIHTSVSGEVIDIRETLTPNGIFCQAVVIKSDGLGKDHPSLKPKKDYKEMSREEILATIKEAGIVGLGGAGFPTHIKLDPPKDKKIDTIILNAAECEPYLTTDHRVLLEETQVIIRGFEIVLHLFPGAKGLIAIETNKQDAIDLFEEACKGREDIKIVHLDPKYPQGAEKQLIYACTKREVPSGKLPADIGVIVNNVDTIIAIERSLVRGRPLLRKVVTIAGNAIKNPGNYKIRLGMKYQDMIDIIGGFKEKPAKMISGGPMMGVAMFDLNIPVVKTSAAFLCFDEEESKIDEERNCIRCGRCVTSCPAGLVPLELNQLVIAKEIDKFVDINGMDCIECGVCSFVCPSKRHLAQSIRVARRDVMAKRKK